MSYLTNAGPLIWLILPLGVLGLIAAVRHFGSPAKRSAAAAAGSSAAAVLLGLVSLGLGYQKSQAAGAAFTGDATGLVLRGLAESFNGVVVASSLAFFACLLLTLGAVRTRGAS